MARIAVIAIVFMASRLLGAPRPVEQIERALIISIDGLRPDLLLRGNTPNLHKLFETGSFTFWATTTVTANTMPSHVSMLTGVNPEVHGITWNSELPLKDPVYPNRPTLFELAKRAGLTTALAAGKRKFSIFAEPGALDWSYMDDVEDDIVAKQAVQIIGEHKPAVMLVHLPSVDNVGHSKGWGSPDQMAAIAGADAAVGAILAALDEGGLRGSTLIVITSDHGGSGRTHRPEDTPSRTIPWIANGPGIREGFDLTRVGDLDVDTVDTFTTCCAMLGITFEHRVRGKFVTQILQKEQLLQRLPPSTEPATRP